MATKMISAFLLAAWSLAAGCLAVPEPEGVDRFLFEQAGEGAVRGAEAETAEAAPGQQRGALLTSSGKEPATAAESAPQPAGAPDAGKRLIVYTATFGLLVANLEDAVENFMKKAEALGGYLQSRDNASLTVRVPAAQFKKLLDDLKTLGIITEQSINALDVTRQFMDLSLRIETAEKARQRLLALLERADKVEDALKIEQEVRRLTEEIERMKGELKLLSEQIAFSTVTVRFLSSAPPPVPVRKRARSRFTWINRVGVEHVLEDF
ncbi:MAG: DUF4349 domain-containing protein [Planctomycetes bacterium]|nr:DUF4349 domain-containing protein [Planctomycetota bacterium]